MPLTWPTWTVAFGVRVGVVPLPEAVDVAFDLLEPHPATTDVSATASAITFSLIRRTYASGVPGDVVPRQVPIGRRLFGEAEHALAEDVAHDLRGPALDRVGPAAQEAADRTAGGVAVGPREIGLMRCGSTERT